MSLNAREIAAVVAELAPLVGSRVDAVHLESERALTLDLHGRTLSARLLVCAEADLTRIHAVRSRRRCRGPARPFERILGREIEGARLAGMESLPGDRVVLLRFEGARGEARLVGELTGRHGNLFLLGSDGVIRASAARNLSERRLLVPGQPYVPPAARADRDEEIRFAVAAGEPFPLSAAIEDAYAAREEERALAEARRRLREPVRAAVARAERAIERLAAEAARVPAAEEDRRVADLLKANLSLVRRGMREVAVTEWTAEGAREARISLDPALSPRENLERYYRRYRRIVDSAARVAARDAEVRARLVALGSLLARIDAAPQAELERVEKEARRLGAAPRPPPAARRGEGPKALPYRSFVSLAGAAILVGKGAEENDALTLRVARGNDLWLHARGVAGAHVIVRLLRGKPVDQETLLDAAHLAAHFSDERGEPLVEVASTRAKYVRKAKGAPPGTVTYSQEKVLALRVERARLERLLAEEEGGG